MLPLPSNLNGVAGIWSWGGFVELPPNIDPFAADTAEVGAAAAAVEVVERTCSSVMVLALGGDVFVDDVDGVDGAENGNEGDDDEGTGWVVMVGVVVLGGDSTATASELGVVSANGSIAVAGECW